MTKKNMTKINMTDYEYDYIRLIIGFGMTKSGFSSLYYRIKQG